MSRFFGPVSLVAIAVAVIGLFLRQPALTVTGAALWIGTVAVTSIRKDGERHSSEISAEGRAHLRPLKRLRDEIKGIVDKNTDNPTVKVIGNETLVEADALIVRAGSIVDTIDDLRKIAKGLKASEQEVAKLESRLKVSDSLPEKDSLNLALEVRKSEVEHLKKAEAGIAVAQGMLRDSETALLAIKAQLTAAAIGDGQDDLDPEGLRGMVGRLKSLSTSLEEAEQTMEQVR